MRKLILIKHASPLVIPVTPPEQWKLSDKGRESCAALAEALREHEPAIIISSEEPKAQETAQLAASRLGVPTESAANLHEHDRTNVPHMRSGEFISHMELFFRRPDERVLGRESADEALSRFEKAVDSVVAAHSSGNIAIVTHGTVLALYLASHNDRDPFHLWRELGLPSFVALDLATRKITGLVAKV
jgi:broad specificity phosphatase PhoE